MESDEFELTEADFPGIEQRARINTIIENDRNDTEIEISKEN